MKSFSGVQKIAILKALCKKCHFRALIALSINFRIVSICLNENAQKIMILMISKRKKTYSVGNSYLRDFVYCLLQNHICNTAGNTKIWLLSLSTEKVIWKRRHTYTKPIKKYAHKSCNWRFQYSFSHQSLPIVPFFFFRREKILLGKRCRFHCSWKLVALSLTVLTLILSSVIAYFGGKFFCQTS